MNYVKSVSTDYEVTRQWAVDVSRQIDRRRLGLVTPQEVRRAANADKSLLALLEEFTKLRRASKITDKEAGTVNSQCKRLFEMMEATTLSDFTHDGVLLAVSALNDAEELSLETCNKYLKAAKRFARHLARYAGFHDEIRWLKPYNAATDVVHGRRALTEDEVERLLRAAAGGGMYMQISGRERELVYLLAVTSGLRANEIRTLSPEHFLLDKTPPVVVVEAKNSKHRKRDEQPIRRDVARRLRTFIGGKPASEPVWVLPDKAFLMLKDDYAAAEPPIEYETYEGFADFHSLRHTYGTRLGNAPNAKIKTVQMLMRHSDIRLTARYMHATLHDEVGAIESMPAVGEVEAAQQAATGTFGVQRHVQRSPVPHVPASAFKFPSLVGENGSNPRDNIEKNAANVPAAILNLDSQSVGLRSRRLKVRPLSGTLKPTAKSSGLHAGGSKGAAGSAARGAAPNRADGPPLDLQAIRQHIRQLTELLDAAARTSNVKEDE